MIGASCDQTIQITAIIDSLFAANIQRTCAHTYAGLQMHGLLCPLRYGWCGGHDVYRLDYGSMMTSQLFDAHGGQVAYRAKRDGSTSNWHVVLHTHTHTHTHTRARTHTHAHTNQLHVVCCVFVCMCMCVCVFMNVSVSVCVCVVYTHTRAHKNTQAHTNARKLNTQTHSHTSTPCTYERTQTHTAQRGNEKEKRGARRWSFR